jgi:dienelactone hydrolase
MTGVNRTTVRIPTPSGFDIEAWFYLPEGQRRFPAVVMGHGLGAVKVGGLASFGERFCQEGFAAVVIDYRQWGGSDGQEPRDELNVPRQREDYSTAIGWAAAPTGHRRTPDLPVGHLICGHARHRAGRRRSPSRRCDRPMPTG